MVAHATIYDGALAQVTSILSGDKGICNTEERSKYHKMRGCCLATIISMHGSNEGDNVDDDDTTSDEEDERLLTQPLTPRKRAIMEETPVMNKK
jgi:hypothetical protein